MVSSDDIIKGLIAKGWTLQNLASTFSARGRNIGYVNISFFTLLVLDWVYRIEDEVAFIWRKQWSGGTLMYLFLRFYAVLLQVYQISSLQSRIRSIEFCKGFYWSYSIGFFIQIFAIQILLQGRVYALYGCSKTILALNAIMFLAAVASIAVLLHQQLPLITVFLVPKPIKGCWGIVSRLDSTLSFTARLTSAAIRSDPPRTACPSRPPSMKRGSGYSCYKAYIHLSAYKKFTRSVVTGEALLAVLVRDSFLWFTAAVFLMFGNMAAFIVEKDGYNFICLPITQFATCAGGCRLVMNVRKAYFTGGDITEATQLGTFRAAPRAMQTGVESTFLTRISFAVRTHGTGVEDSNEREADFAKLEDLGIDVYSAPRDPEAVFGMHIAAVEKMRREQHQKEDGGDPELTLNPPTEMSLNTDSPDSLAIASPQSSRLVSLAAVQPPAQVDVRRVPIQATEEKASDDAEY
ncbi:hypothetical protein FRB99_003049 [Tulasnella sp. 403]|nr:hypothetical protein FRB99_003049 [Tulasnella sp. 403]